MKQQTKDTKDPLMDDAANGAPKDEDPLTDEAANGRHQGSNDG